MIDAARSSKSSRSVAPFRNSLKKIIFSSNFSWIREDQVLLGHFVYDALTSLNNMHVTTMIIRYFTLQSISLQYKSGDRQTSSQLVPNNQEYLGFVQYPRM